MGREPLVLKVGTWDLIVEMNDHGLRIQLLTDPGPGAGNPRPAYYMTLTIDQARELECYLNDVVPIDLHKHG